LFFVNLESSEHNVTPHQCDFHYRLINWIQKEIHYLSQIGKNSQYRLKKDEKNGMKERRDK
jgi:hypothetical protein